MRVHHSSHYTILYSFYVTTAHSFFKSAFWAVYPFVKLVAEWHTLQAYILITQHYVFHSHLDQTVLPCVATINTDEHWVGGAICDVSVRCFSHHSDETGKYFYSERPLEAGFRSVNPAERWRENPARALARAGFSQHLKCGIHRSESSPEGSFALIPRPVARWAKTAP